MLSFIGVGSLQSSMSQGLCTHESGDIEEGKGNAQAIIDLKVSGPHLDPSLADRRSIDGKVEGFCLATSTPVCFSFMPEFDPMSAQEETGDEERRGFGLNINNVVSPPPAIGERVRDHRFAERRLRYLPRQKSETKTEKKRINGKRESS